MVEFITLFLGALVVGPTPVQLRVDREVATLVVVLDTEPVVTLRGAPWQAEVDFGSELAPHLLEAIGLAADGSELGRARQWVNQAPQQAEVLITLERDPTSEGARARLSWQSLTAENEPIGVRAQFDGRDLEVEAPRSFPLPPHSLDELHHLRVELEFPGSLRSVAEVTFGGSGYSDVVSTELTAFPVSLAGLPDLPSIDAMQAWFHVRGTPLSVDAVESGLAEIVVVRDRAAERYLHNPSAGRRGAPARPILREDHRLRFFGVSPVQLQGGESPFVVFPRSPEVRDRVSGLARNLSWDRLPIGPAGEQRLADAVAVAGLFASQSGRRRAVVVITAGDPVDTSQFSPALVGRYLRRLGVPLVVWNPRRGGTEGGGWGAAVNISTQSRLSHAYDQLSRMLDRQRIVWLNGLHLPQTIALAAEVEGVRRVQ